jgi:hypothetical protein
MTAISGLLTRFAMTGAVTGGAGCGLEDMADAKPKNAKPNVKVSARNIMP